MGKNTLFLFRMRPAEFARAYEIDPCLRKENLLPHLHLLKETQSGWYDGISGNKNIYLVFCNQTLDMIFVNLFKNAPSFEKVADTFHNNKSLYRLLRICFAIGVLCQLFFLRPEKIVFYDTHLPFFVKKIAHALGVVIIEYDGRPPKTWRSANIKLCGHKHYLLSCMNLSERIVGKKENFRLLQLGLDEKIIPEELDFDRPVDISFFGTFDPDVWALRCKTFEALLKKYTNCRQVMLYGEKKNISGFPNLDRYDLKFVGSSMEMRSKLLKTKVSVLVSSEDHMEKTTFGLPSKVFENASFGVLQFASFDAGLESIGLIDGEHYVGYGSVGDLLDKIDMVLGNYEFWRHIPIKAHQKIRENYTAQKCFVNATRGLFSSIDEPA